MGIFFIPLHLKSLVILGKQLVKHCVPGSPLWVVSLLSWLNPP